MLPPSEIQEILSSWTKLNAFIMDPETTISECIQVIDAEFSGLRRRTFCIRIQHRINKLRGLKVLQELKKKLGYISER